MGGGDDGVRGDVWNLESNNIEDVFNKQPFLACA